MRRHAKASPARSQITIGGLAFGLACFCLLAVTALTGTGTGSAAAATAECPNEAIRIAQGATRLPDCRAYERISPADATGVIGVDLTNRPMFGAIRADGDAATFPSSTAVGESERGASRTFNLAHRTATGWTSFGVLTTSQPDVPFDQSMSPAWPVPSADMSRMMFTSLRSLGPPNPVAGNGSVYLSAPEGKGPPTWLSHWSSEGNQPNPPGSTSISLGGAPDLSSGYFRYATRLTSLAGDDLRTSPSGLYYFEGSTIVPAGVLPSGAVSPQGALPAGIGGTSFTTSDNVFPELARNEVSADGSKLFFVSPVEGVEPRQLYVEEGGKPGRLISHDTLGNPATDGVFSLARAAYATADGSRVLFRSESALTEDAPTAGIKTYRADISPSAITLTYLPAVSGLVLAIDRDASKILFETAGSAPGQTSYYVWDESNPTAPYAVATDLPPSSGPEMLEPVFSEDGDVLVFASGAEIQPGVVPLAEHGYTQIYRWTKQSQTATCISCLSAGTPARFGSRLGSMNKLPTDNPAFPGGGEMEPFTQSSVVGNRKISSDGSRVFFDTSDPLDPARDVNGTRDVYMWENGKTYLLTSGRNPIPSMVIDSSESGNDVMLVTADGLIPSDTNGTYDAYDVRVDGGFAEPKEEGCEGDACQSSNAAPAASSPASRSVSGAGNQRQARLGAVKLVQLGKPGKTAQVQVSVPAAGHLKLAGKLVKGKSRSVKVKGAVKLRLGLTKTGKRKLAAKGHLTTKVTATFGDAEGRTKKSSITLRFKQGGHR